MDNEIKMSELISTELRSRTEAKKVQDCINLVMKGKIVINFSDVTFISRSFADEFCEILEQVNLSRKVELINKSENIDITLSIVQENRNTPKNIQQSSDTKEFSDMDSLSQFLATI